MKFNTNLYKLSLFTENVCEDCTKLKEILKDNNIPFYNRSISTKTDEDKKTNGDNRWDFIDAESEDTRFRWFTPVLIIEDSDGNITYIPSVQDTVNCDGGKCLNTLTLDNIKIVLKPYLV